MKFKFTNFKIFLGIAIYAFVCVTQSYSQLRPSAPSGVEASYDTNIMRSYKSDAEKNEIAAKEELTKKLKEPFELKSSWISKNYIDSTTHRFHNSKKIQPANLCTDSVFLRRVFLDLTGTLPSMDNVADFIADKSPAKREKLVDKLIESTAFEKYWTMRIGDILRIKAEFPINLWPNAAQAYTQYVEVSIKNNVPYSDFVRKMLTASGSNFRKGEVNFFRAMQGRSPEKIASAICQTFMNTRPESLDKKTLENISKFFERVSYKSTKEWKEEIVFSDPLKAKTFKGTLPNGEIVELTPDIDPREVFATWLTSKGNPYFSKAFVNRVWAWIFGTALATPIDDMFSKKADIPCPELLDVLAKSFENSNYNFRKLCRQIVLSRTYQQSSIPSPENNPRVARKNFAVYGVRQMDAEILIDALCKVSGTSEIYSSTTPEPYTTMPDYARALDIPDGSITSSFLELFGKSPRDTGSADERNLNPSALQKLHLINSSHIRNKINSGPLLRKCYSYKGDAMINSLYLNILSRYPSDMEKQVFANYLKTSELSTYEASKDLAWALINSDEFIFRH